MSLSVNCNRLRLEREEGKSRVSYGDNVAALSLELSSFCYFFANLPTLLVGIDGVLSDSAAREVQKSTFVYESVLQAKTLCLHFLIYQPDASLSWMLSLPSLHSRLHGELATSRSCRKAPKTRNASSSPWRITQRFLIMKIKHWQAKNPFLSAEKTFFLSHTHPDGMA